MCKSRACFLLVPDFEAHKLKSPGLLQQCARLGTAFLFGELGRKKTDRDQHLPKGTFFRSENTEIAGDGWKAWVKAAEIYAEPKARSLSVAP